MELGEQVCRVCGGDGWSDWPYLPCFTCEGSGFDGPVLYLKPDDRAGWFRDKPVPVPVPAEAVALPQRPRPVAKPLTDWNEMLASLVNSS